MGIIWVLWALLSAFMAATNDALTKRVLISHNEYLIGSLRLLWSLPFFGCALLFVPFPGVDSTFFIAFFIALPLEVTAVVLYVKALKLSPLTLTLPFLSLSPVFLIVIPYLILGEKISLTGTVGVLMIAGGGYTLNIGEMKKGIMAPLRAIRREKGSVYMIGVALIYSVTATLGKMAIEHSSPVFFGVTYNAALAVALIPLALYKNRGNWRLWSRRTAVTGSLIPGFCHAASILSHMIAISLTQVAYMISVKRLSLLMGVLYGWLLFRETNIRERLVGTMLMVMGFVLIILFH